MLIPPGLRRLTFTVHVVSSLGWIGALTVFMAHAVAGLTIRDEQAVRAVYIAMGMTAWLVILPLAVASFASGLVQAWGTSWGFFRHYWVVFKLLLTLVATAVLLMKLGPIDALAEAAAKSTWSTEGLVGARTSVMLHAVGGIAVLLAAATLAIYKPAAMTRYGVRLRHRHADRAHEADLRAIPRTPAWVKAFGALVIVLTLLIVIMMLGGGHGPKGHVG